MPASKARAKPPRHDGRPPEPTRTDESIRRRGGTTMAIELSQFRIQKQKNHPPLSPEQILMDLRQREGLLRLENGFYRGCFKASCQMVDEVHAVCQLLMLAYYYNPEFPAKILEEMHQLALELQKSVDNYESCVLQMEKDWIDEWPRKEGHRISEYRSVI